MGNGVQPEGLYKSIGFALNWSHSFDWSQGPRNEWFSGITDAI